MRAVIVGVLGLLLHGGVAAAGEGPPDVEALRDAYRAGVDRLLAADDVRLQAWGAHLAGGLDEGADASLADSLVRQAQRHGRGTMPEARRATKAALDALIRLEAPVSPSKLYPLYRTHRVEVLLLLARSGRGAIPHLLDALQVPTADAVWMAVVGLLAREKAPGLAAHLLADLEVTIQASVLPDRNSLIGIGGGDGRRPGMPQGIQPSGVLEGWPPPVAWILTDRPEPDALVVLPGDHPVHAIRSFVQGPVYSDAATTSLSRNDYRFVALAALLKRPVERMDLEEEERLTIYWEGDEDYVKRVQDRWRVVKINHRFTVDLLKQKGLLTADEVARLQPRVTVRGEWLGVGEKSLPAVSEPE